MSNLNFEIGPGESIVLLKNWGRKVNVRKNISRLVYDFEGEVLINGADQRSFAREDSENLFGYLPQEVMLFSGTISENITGFKNQNQSESSKQQKRSEFMSLFETGKWL